MSFGTTHAITTRPLTMGRTSAVVAGHHLAAQAGIDVLRTGGNAMDAAIAAAGALSVLKPDACGLGSDLFLVYHDAASGATHALNASGPAPLAATLGSFAKGIPRRGLAAAAVPGTVHGWEQALQRFGTRSLAATLAPAIDLARQGMPISALFASTLATNRAELEGFPNTMAAFYPDGRTPETGDLLPQPDLARTLAEIAGGGAAAFYAGRFADALDRYAREQGAPLRGTDLASYASQWAPALRATYRDTALFGQPPVSVGVVVLEAMQILANFDIGALDPTGADVVHLHLEAMKRALADVRGSVGDPAFAPASPVSVLLDPAHAAQRAGTIDMHRASFPAPVNVLATGNDTSYVAAIDRHGNGVSLLQSVFNVFGCADVVPGTGVLMNNRMTGFSLDPASPNALAPGKRAMNTLNPFIAVDARGGLMCFGTPGGPSQTFTNALLLLRVLDAGYDLQRAVDAPRWFLSATNEVQMEDAVPASVRDELVARGHTIAVVPRHSAALGGAGMLRINTAGVREAAADPRRESYALAF
jgi:gamma-glutamyltranspeptidase/glutathione hydrolase